MTEQEYEWVDPRLAEAVEERGMTGYMRLLLGLAGRTTIDEATQKGLFWQLIGYLGAEAGRRAVRPWQIIATLELVIIFIMMIMLNNIYMLTILGGL